MVAYICVPSTWGIRSSILGYIAKQRLKNNEVKQNSQQRAQGGARVHVSAGLKLTQEHYLRERACSGNESRGLHWQTPPADSPVAPCWPAYTS